MKQSDNVGIFSFSLCEDNIRMVADYANSPDRAWVYPEWHMFSRFQDLCWSLGLNGMLAKPKGRSMAFKGIWECAPEDEADLKELCLNLKTTPTVEEMSADEAMAFARSLAPGNGICRPQKHEDAVVEHLLYEVGKPLLPVTHYSNLWNNMRTWEKPAPAAGLLVEGLAAHARWLYEEHPCHPIEALRRCLYAPRLMCEDPHWGEDSGLAFKYDHVLADAHTFLVPMVPLIAGLMEEGLDYGAAIRIIDDAGVFRHLAVWWLPLGADSAEDHYETFSGILGRHRQQQ